MNADARSASINGNGSALRRNVPVAATVSIIRHMNNGRWEEDDHAIDMPEPMQ